MKRLRGKSGECPTKEVLNSHVDGELDSAHSEALSEHLAECEDCSRAVEELAWLKTRVSSLTSVSEQEPDYDRMWLEIERRLRAGRPAPAPRFPRKVLWAVRPLQWKRLAAAAAALVIIIGSAVMLMRTQTGQEEAASVEPTRPVSGEASTAAIELPSGPEPQWEDKLDRWFADSRLFLIGASLVCERAGGGEACEGFRLRAGQLADEGTELAELLSDHGAPFEDTVVSEVVLALQHLAAQPGAIGLREATVEPLTEVAVNAIFDINILDMYRRETVHATRNADL